MKVPVKYDYLVAPSSSSIYSILDPHLNSLLLQNLVENCNLIEIAERYLRAKPVLMNSQIWYTFPQEGGQGHHNFGFHYDIDDYRFIKFFFYLDDVTEQHGPHVIIRGSHNEGSIFKFFNRRISNELARRRYSDSIVVMTGKKGSGFAEDTYCYHKGTYPIFRRLLLQIEFGITEGDELCRSV